MCFMDHKTQSSIGDSFPNKAMEGKSIKPKEKRRNNEKRKEKSRDAARCRRSRETEIFTELGETLPIRKDELDNLDKASVMRLAIATLKIENMMKLFKISSDAVNPSQIIGNFNENAAMKALDGFLIALSADGDVTYVSENIHEHIGIQQIDMIGNPIWEYTHQCDHIELRDILNIRRIETLGSDQTLNDSRNMSRHALIRMKCTLTSRGRNINIKSASFKVMNIVGHTVVDEQQCHHQFIGIARLVPHPSNIEVPLDSKTFLSKHSLNMKFSYVDDKMLPVLGYKPDDLLDKSLYEYHHGADSEMLMSAFKNVINKGQTETPQYRFLGRNGGFCWVVSQATLVYDKQKPQSVVCVNYVISGLLEENEVYSLRQLEALKALPQIDKIKIQEKKIDFKLENIEIQRKQENYRKLPNLDIDKNNSLNKIDNIENIKSIKSDSTIRRTFLANHLNITPIKGNPKAVTASVFKALPSLKQKLILSNNTNVQRAKKPTLQSSKHIASSFMKTEPVDIIESFGEVHSKISEPSILPRQTVVTASLFQAQRENTEGVFLNNNTSTDLYFSETMNKTFSQSNDGECRTTPLEPDQIRNKVPSKSISNSVSSQKTILSSSFGMLNKPLSNNTSNDNSLLSLGESTPLFGEMFNELILPDGLSTILPEEIQSIDEQARKIGNNFISYASGKIVSPGKSKNMFVSSNISKSPECSSSLPSLCSPNSFSRNEEFTFMSASLDNDDIDLSMRAPYIPMNENDDLPLLTEDLMWSAFSDEVSLNKNIKSGTDFQSQPSQPPPTTTGNLDQNLMNDVQKTPSSIDSSFVSPTLNSFINTKYIDSGSNVKNKQKQIEKHFKIGLGQRETSNEQTCHGDMTMINNVISIDTEDMLMKEPIVECDLESTAINNLKDDNYSSENEKVQSYTIQNNAFIKNCADNMLLQWTINNTTDNDEIVNGKKFLDPSKNIFSCEIQSETNIMNNNHKRCSPLEIGVIKRLRCHVNPDCSNLNTIESIHEHNSSLRTNQHKKNIQNSQLLQQLMAPFPQRNGENACPESKNFEGTMKESTQWNHSLNRTEDQSSDSVLKNLLCNDVASGLSEKKTLVGESYGAKVMKQNQEGPENVKIENELIYIDNGNLIMYGLIEDAFLIDELNLNSTDQITENVPPFFVDDNMNGTISEKKPFESFEKQITISVPQPPPLKAEAFTIGGGLFQGITDNISILPTSLISPMERNNFNCYDSIKSDTNNMMDIWNSELE